MRVCILLLLLNKRMNLLLYTYYTMRTNVRRNVNVKCDEKAKFNKSNEKKIE